MKKIVREPATAVHTSDEELKATPSDDDRVYLREKEMCLLRKEEQLRGEKYNLMLQMNYMCEFSELANACSCTLTWTVFQRVLLR
jgi:hypothetical protein